ncbi:hypothetical protein EJB05_14439, partial [Eragrostis curvula]
MTIQPRGDQPRGDWATLSSSLVLGFECRRRGHQNGFGGGRWKQLKFLGFVVSSGSDGAGSWPVWSCGS